MKQSPTELEIFYVWTDTGPVRCERHIPKTVSKNLLAVSDQLDTELEYYEKNYYKRQ